jgi:periplasmic protein TonB
MDFARQQRDPARHLIGITFVVLFHAIVIYALVTGLARKAVEVIKKPLTATIIEEIKAPPPPPPPPPPRKIVEPPKSLQPYVPPPDVPVPTQTTEPVISSVTATPPTEPVVIAPPAPPPVVEAPPPPKPAIRRGAVPIERVEPVYPREAIKDNISNGKVVARLQVDEKGLVTNVTIVEANPRRVFDREVIRALSLWKFKPEGDRYIAEIEITFVLN